jgi:hypothetical protein
MTTQEKKEKIEALVIEILNDSKEAMVKKITMALNCGALDIEDWDENKSPMIVPKIIIAALLESESTQYSARGTSFEKKIKKEVKNLRYYI